jgi:DNA-binding transcriptional LysR family regulator
MRFDLVDLRLFLHVAEARSITHGAERANLALASASARIRGMEETLGVPLLVRDRRGVSLSPAGQCLLEHARLITQQVETMRRELGSFARGLAGSVHLVSNTAAWSEHLPQIIGGSLRCEISTLLTSGWGHSRWTSRSGHLRTSGIDQAMRVRISPRPAANRANRRRVTSSHIWKSNSRLCRLMGK